MTDVETLICRVMGAEYVTRTDVTNDHCFLWERKPKQFEYKGHTYYDMADGPIASVDSKLFPSVERGHMVKVQEKEIIDCINTWLRTMSDEA